MRRIVGYHIENGLLANSDGEYCTEWPYIDFLLDYKQDSIKVLYHMGYGMAQILLMLKAEKGDAKQLQRDGSVRIGPYLVKHRASRFLSIRKGQYASSSFSNFSDMSQYRNVVLENKQRSVIECIDLAKEAQKIGEEVYKAMRSIGLDPASLTSPINAYEKGVLSKANLPTVDDMPEEAAYYAYQCCQGNWLEAFQLGHWEKTWDYDINSAYPAELQKLLDIRLGKWVKSESWVPEAEYAFCKAIVTIKQPFSPVIYSKNTSEDIEMNYTPTGTWERFLTKRKIWHIINGGRGDVKIIDGWYWIPEEKKPVLYNLIEQLYWQKRQSEGIARDVVKRTMSGIWGKFLQVMEDGFGELFNPVYGAEVESNVRTKVSEFILTNGIDPIHISVDGVLSPTPVDIGQNGGRIGNWELSGIAPCFCIGTATVAVQQKRGEGDFSIDYDWLMEQVKSNPEASEYQMSKPSPVTMAVALNGNWEELGQIRTITKTIYITGEGKRHYKISPQNGRELLARTYPSEPWDVSFLSNLVVPQEEKK